MPGMATTSLCNTVQCRFKTVQVNGGAECSPTQAAIASSGCTRAWQYSLTERWCTCAGCRQEAAEVLPARGEAAELRACGAA